MTTIYRDLIENVRNQHASLLVRLCKLDPNNKPHYMKRAKAFGETVGDILSSISSIEDNNRVLRETLEKLSAKV